MAKKKEKDLAIRRKKEELKQQEIEMHLQDAKKKERERKDEIMGKMHHKEEVVEQTMSKKMKNL